ncbi:MAG: DnaB-like helicase N-terminal domain-containing protein [Hymenobacter sp.]
MLKAHSFYNDAHQRIYKAISNLFDKSGAHRPAHRGAGAARAGRAGSRRG